MKRKFIAVKKWALLPVLLFVFFSCRKDNPASSPAIEKEFNVAGFNRVYAGDEINLVITKGAAFQVKAKGPAGFVNDLELTVANQILDIRYKHYVQNRSKVDVIITVPALASVALAGAGTGTVTGFQDQPYVISAVLSGASKLTMNGTGINMHVDITGGSQFTVNGATANLYGNISGGGKLNAYNLTATEVDISTSGGSTAYVKVENVLFASASGGSRIYYKGNPGTKNIETSGGGQVIQE
jgi:hypothetical protein